MHYDEFHRRCPDFCDRYMPALVSKANAYSALRTIDNDPFVTAIQNELLVEYVGNYTTQNLITYRWCDECEFMVGFEGRHSHCDECALPCAYLLTCDMCCDCCEDHCFVCDSCESHSLASEAEYHRDCGRCNSCCQCDEEEDDEEELEEDEDFEDEDEDEITPAYGKALLALSKQDKITFNCSRLAGVEWEYNYVNKYKALDDWKNRWGGAIHADASCGEEAVTPPMAGDYITKVIAGLGTAFKNDNVSIDDTCSVHVHVDAHDYSWHDIFKLLKVYSKLESFLYLLAGQQRLNNKYCAPVGKDFEKLLRSDCPDPKGAVLALALKAVSSKDARELQRKKSNKKPEGRRRGLNISPWLAARRNKSPDATVEFRMHRDTNDPLRVIGWTKLCVRLVDWCVKASDKDISNLPKSPLRSLCQVIAPDCSPWILSRVKSWRESTKFAGKFRRRIHVRGGKYEY